jgi:hypothetical protein
MRPSNLLLGCCLVIAAAAACSAGSTAASASGAGGDDQGAGAGGDAGAGGEGGAGGADNPDPSGATLRLDPLDAVIGPMVEGAGATQVFHAFYKAKNGAEVDVSDEANWSSNSLLNLGNFTGATFTSTPGITGKTQITATARGVSASTSLTVAATKTIVIGPGAPPDAASQFSGGDDPGNKPTLAYPPDGILVPPNMNSLEIHFIPAAGQKLFAIDFASPVAAFTVYTGCDPVGQGCAYTPDKSFWSALADASRGTAPVSYSVRGITANGGKVGTSAPQTIQFANEDIVGGLYYWNSAAGSVQRYDFGYPGKQSETFLNGPGAGALTCVGCHVLSRDGTKIAVGLDIPAPAPYKLFDVATKKQIFPQPGGATGNANFFSFSPDGSQLLTSDGVSITMREADSGNPITTVIKLGTMPDWSPDGKSVVFARPQTAPPFGLPIPGVDSALIGKLTYDGTTWSSPQVLVPFDGQNNYYPAFSPDQGWVAFNRSPSNKNSFDNGSTDKGNVPDGEIWVVSSTGGAPMKLARASAPGGGDQWPKWSPNVMTYQGGNVMWLTFASQRSYGLRQSGGPDDKAQLWMVAFDPQKAAKGEDGSFPAFWMPFQDVNSGNHIAQWVTQIVRKPCKKVADCDQGEACNGAACVPDIK